MSAKLSTHVLDNHNGKPAAGVSIKLERLSDQAVWETVAEACTNADGRTDGPLLSGDALTTGRYRLLFQTAPYYASRNVPLADPPFLDEICLQVNLIAGQSYHVPLLMTPWSYSTYRGS